MNQHHARGSHTSKDNAAEKEETFVSDTTTMDNRKISNTAYTLHLKLPFIHKYIQHNHRQIFLFECVASLYPPNMRCTEYIVIWLRTKKYTNNVFGLKSRSFFFQCRTLWLEMTSDPLRNILYINRAHCHTYKQQNVEKTIHWHVKFEKISYLSRVAHRTFLCETSEQHHMMEKLNGRGRMM